MENHTNQNTAMFVWREMTQRLTTIDERRTEWKNREQLVIAEKMQMAQTMEQWTNDYLWLKKENPSLVVPKEITMMLETFYQTMRTTWDFRSHFWMLFALETELSTKLRGDFPFYRHHRMTKMMYMINRMKFIRQTTEEVEGYELTWYYEIRQLIWFPLPPPPADGSPTENSRVLEIEKIEIDDRHDHDYSWSLYLTIKSQIKSQNGTEVNDHVGGKPVLIQEFNKEVGRIDYDAKRKRLDIPEGVIDSLLMELGTLHDRNINLIKRKKTMRKCMLNFLWNILMLHHPDLKIMYQRKEKTTR